MGKKLRRILPLFLIIAMVSALYALGAWAADTPGGAPSGMPAGMSGPPGGGGPGGPGGGPPGGGPGGGPPGGGMGGTPQKAAIFIKNGAENTAKEYVAGKYAANIKSGANGIIVKNLYLTSGSYTFNGIVATGEKSVVSLDNCKMRLDVTKEASPKETGGAAASVSDKATMYINHSDLTVSGALRYVTNTSDDSKLIVNDSSITQTGSNKFTTKMSEPFSNPKLLISGIARANMSTGSSHTYYFNSTVTTEGWAALSTDSSSGDGLDLYAYNTRAIAQHGGYGTYADFGCRVWLYGSTLRSAEVGAIISKSGKIMIADGASVPANVIKYDTGKTTTAGSVVMGGRNAVMIHAPDMMHQGKAAADCGTLDVINSTLVTNPNLKSTRNYAKKYGKAIGAYVDYIKGAAILIKSTSANINLVHSKIKSFTGVAILTVLNNDSMGNYLKDGDANDTSKVKPIAISMKDMKVTGDIRHMDYQRVMTVSLENTVLRGAVISGTMADWNSLWTRFKKKDCNWLVNTSWKTRYGVKLTLKRGATWDVTGASSLSSLTVERGGVLKGIVRVDGKTITPAPGKTYTGMIVVKPL